SRAALVKTLGWIAINGFREAVRDKVMYSLVAFAVLLIVASYIVGELTAGQDVKITKDLGLSAIGIFGLSWRSSSASGWCRRKSSGAAFTACSPSPFADPTW